MLTKLGGTLASLSAFTYIEASLCILLACRIRREMVAGLFLSNGLVAPGFHRRPEVHPEPMSDRTVLSPWPAARRIQPECAQCPGWAMVLGQWLERPPLALCQCQTVTVAPHVTAAGAGGGGSDGAARRYRASRAGQGVARAPMSGTGKSEPGGLRGLRPGSGSESESESESPRSLRQATLSRPQYRAGSSSADLGCPPSVVPRTRPVPMGMWTLSGQLH